MKRQHEVFIQEMARYGDQVNGEVKAYRIAYPKVKDDESARVCAHRLLKNVTIQNEIATRRSIIVAKADEIAVQEIKKERKLQILTMATKRQILHDIASGKKQPATDRNGKKYYRFPDDADRIKAIELDNEISGEGWRPPEQPPGNTFNGNVYNTVIRKTVFKTREKTSIPQQFTQPPEE